jgi:hypothetical protein
MFIQLKNLQIGYDKPLITNINTYLKQGDVCLIIGNNGIGKTTLIKTLLRQIPILSGEIFINNKNLKKLSLDDISKLISIVFSKAEIPNNYTTNDLISFGKFTHYNYYIKLSQKDNQEIENIIKKLNLENYKNHYLKTLSDGNFQKTLIGRALAQNTPFIILDEPTNHLDEQNKISILKILRNMAKKMGKTILFSSHDWRLATKFSDKIWYIKDKTLFSGLTEDILNQHSELIEMNFLENIPLVLPKIIAPNTQTELLISFLKKHIQRDLSNYSFEYKNEFWIINNKYICRNFEDLLNLFNNY